MENSSAERDVFQALVRNVTAVVPSLAERQIDPRGRLSDYGCNSIERSDIVWKTLDDLGLDIPITEFSGIEDISGLTKLLARHWEIRRNGK